MPRNFVTVNGTVNIDGAARQKDISLFSYGNGLTPELMGKTTSATDGSYSVYGLKARGAHVIGVATSDYGPTWLPSTAYTVGQKILPKTPNRHWYTCATAGTSGTVEPNWGSGGDFTIECWMKKTSSSNASLISKLGASNQGFACITRGGAVGFMVNGFEYVTAPNATTTNSWYHVAWVMSGSTLSIYVDGTIRAQQPNLTIAPNTYDLVIGADKGTGSLANFFDGYLDSIRITKGVARYTGNSFTVPTQDFLTYGPADPLWNETKILSRFDGTDGATVFQDEKGATWINSGAVIKTDQSKFGGSSAYFTGSVGSYLRLAESADYNLNGDWTAETFFRLDGSNVTPHIFEISINAGNRVNVFRDNQGNLTFYSEFGGSGAPRVTAPISPNTWYHVALVRTSDGVRMFLNGNLVGAYTGSQIPTSSTMQVCLGNFTYSPNTNDGLTGWIDEFRFTRAARYKTSFTVPASAYPRVDGDPSYNNVSSLLQFNDNINDAKGITWTMTGSGGSRQFDYKFPPGSLYLVGDGALTTPNTNSLNLSSVTSFTDGTAAWVDGGLVDTPISRGPFQVADPDVDANTIFLTRNHELQPRDEVSNAYSYMLGGYTLASGKFAGENSINFDGSTGGSYYPAISPGSGDWTVEGWFYMNALSQPSSQCVLYIGDLANNNNRLQIGPTSANGIEGFVSAGQGGGASPVTTSSLSSAGSLLQVNTWYHIAFERFGTNTYLYLNGTQVASGTLTAGYWMAPVTTANTYVGTGRVSNVVRYINGRVGEVRVSNIARYQGVASFPAPTAPFTI